MFEIESVAIEARKQFFRAIACVIVSIKKTDDRMDQLDDCGIDFTEDSITLENQVSRFLSLHRDKISLICSVDVYNLLRYLFADQQLLELGFASVKTLQSNITKVTKSESTHLDVYFIRPTFVYANNVCTSLRSTNSDVNIIVVLPQIVDLYPETLHHLLGQNYKVTTFDGNGDLPAPIYNVILIPCEIHAVPTHTNVLSMCLSNSLSDYYLHGDPTSAWLFAKAVEYLEKTFFEGALPSINSLGALGKYCLKLLVKSRRQTASNVIVQGIDKGTDANEGCISFNLKNDTPTPNNVSQYTLLGVSNSFERGIIIDRKMDLVTPMCFNFTYEGLLDSIVGIEQNCINVGTNILDGSNAGTLDLVQLYVPKEEANLKCIKLDSPLYNEIKWLNYNEVGNYLHNRALHIHKGYEMTTNSGNSSCSSNELKTIGEMGKFVKKYKSLQQEHLILAQHVNLMSWMSSIVSSDYFKHLHQLEDGILQGNIDNKNDDSKLANITAKLLFSKSNDPCVALVLDLIFWNIDVVEIYRLLILLSQTCDGIRKTDLNSIKRAIMFQYGFNELITMEQLHKAGAIKEVSTLDSTRWSKICKRLNLLVDKESGMSDYSNVFGGYAPMSLRVSQLLHISQGTSGVLNFEMSLLHCTIATLKQSNVLPTSTNRNNVSKQVLIGFIGGVTLGEIASVSILNAKQKQRYIILTTEIVNYKSIINSFSHTNFV